MSLKILIDANVLIAAESDKEPPHANAERASRLLRLASEAGHRICLASSVRSDFQNITDPVHQARRKRQLHKYNVLERIPFPPGFLSSAGYPIEPTANDLADAALLLAIDQGAADWLVTEDRKLRGHSEIVGLGEQTFSLADALDTLSAGLSQPVDHPAVELTKPYQIILSQPFFDGFDDEYDFTEWWKSKVVPQDRECLTLGEPDALQGLAVLNAEMVDTWGLPGKILKVCTFKIAEEATGAKRGELLLWEVCQRARVNDYDSIFVEVFTSHSDVIALFKSFGFSEIATRAHGKLTDGVEVVLGKVLNPALVRDPPTDPFQYHLRFGPGAVIAERVFVVPVTPTWHRMLFPPRSTEDAEQPTLELGNLGIGADEPAATPYGNAFRKAYLCRAPIRQLEPGHVLLFERTQRDQAVTAVGVVEGTLRSPDPEEIIKFVGRRTVYTSAEVGAMCERGEVLAIRFRLDRVLRPQWALRELIDAKVIRRSPQSIAEASDAEGLKWVQGRLAAWR